VVECSHGQRKALGSSPGRATIFHLLQMAPNVGYVGSKRYLMGIKTTRNPTIYQLLQM